jgi:DNA modification methylase
MGYRVLIGDCIESMRGLPDQSVHTCVTSPPYFGLRDYGMPGQIGLEDTPEAFVARLVDVFREVRRVLRDDGTLWLNLGDSFAKDKNILGIPWRVAFALQANGWYLRQDIIWHKPNPMPESVTDRCTKAHEYIFMLSKSARYFYDAASVKEPAKYVGITGQDASGFKDAKKFDGKHSDKQRGHGRRHAGFNDRWDAMSRAEQCSGLRNRRSVWTVATRPFAGAHFATFPPDLIEPCILAGCPVGGTVLDPFGGSGTTAGVALRNSRNAILCELNPTYAAMMHDRVSSIAGGLFAEAAE